MIILALDTTSDEASVALRRNGLTVAETMVRSSDGYSHHIYGMIREVLDKAAVSLLEVDCFASAAGPGSFTGVRVCLTAAKGLAEATGKPAAAVSNLRALATFGTARLRNPIIDARRGQIYTAIYDSDLVLVSPEIVAEAENWTVDAGVERIASTPIASTPIASTPTLAAAIALCAERDGPGKWSDPAALDANYVRRADAEMSWTDSGRI